MRCRDLATTLISLSRSSGSAHRLADRLGVVGIVLVALHIRLHELRCDQLYAIAQRLQFPCPVMGTAAGLQTDLTAGLSHLAQHLQPALPWQTPPPDGLLEPIRAVQLEHLLGDVDSNARKLHGGLLLAVDWLLASPVWHS